MNVISERIQGPLFHRTAWAVLTSDRMMNESTMMIGMKKAYCSPEPSPSPR